SCRSRFRSSSAASARVRARAAATSRSSRFTTRSSSCSPGRRSNTSSRRPRTAVRRRPYERGMVAASRTSAIFGALGSAQIEELLAAAPLLELNADVVLTPAEFQNECLLVVEDGLAIIRAEHAGTDRGIVTCHAGPGT